MVVTHARPQRVCVQPKVCMHATRRRAASRSSMQRPRPIPHALCRRAAAQLPRQLLAARERRCRRLRIRLLLLLLLVGAAGAAAFYEGAARRAIAIGLRRLLQLLAAAAALEQRDAASSGGRKLGHRELLPARAALPAALHLLRSVGRDAQHRRQGQAAHRLGKPRHRPASSAAAASGQASRMHAVMPTSRCSA